MQLRDAKVDLDGCMLADGVLTLPPQIADEFGLPAGHALRLGNAEKINKITAVRAQQEASGFFSSENLGLSIFLPLELGAALHRALWVNGTDARHLTFGSTLGYLDGPDGRGARRNLTDWTLDLEEVDGGLRARGGARLDPPSGAGADEQRVTFDLTVGDATRAAVVGYWREGLYGEVKVGLAVPEATSLDALNLEAAPVGKSILAATQAGGWAVIHSSSGGYDIFGCPMASLYISWSQYERAADGFVVPRPSMGVGDIHLFGVDLKTLSLALFGQESVTVVLKGDRLGYIGMHHRAHEDYDPVPDKRITEAELTASLDESGLRLAYRLQVNDLQDQQKPYTPGELRDVLTISWEILILRAPYFVGNRRGRFGGPEREAVVSDLPAARGRRSSPLAPSSPSTAVPPSSRSATADGLPAHLRRFPPPSAIVLLLTGAAWLLTAPSLGLG